MLGIVVYHGVVALEDFIKVALSYELFRDLSVFCKLPLLNGLSLFDVELLFNQDLLGVVELEAEEAMVLLEY